MKWIRWSFVVAVGLLLVVAGVVILIFTGWKAERVDELACGSRVANTANGPVEYAVSGEGKAVLVLHGAPGGYDQALVIGKTLAAAGFRVIAPSRPGYLRTPLESGLFFSEQADLMGALLDELKINSVSVVGFSAGASTAVSFAQAFPHRTRSVVLISPLSQTSDLNPSDERTSILLEEETLMRTTGDMGSWALAEGVKRVPRHIADAILSIDSDLEESERRNVVDALLESDERMAFLEDFLMTLAPLSGRESGTRNDLLMLKAGAQMDFSNVEMPVLVVEGRSDATPEWTDLDRAVESAPNARHYEVEDAGRLVWLGPNAEEVDSTILSFLRGDESPENEAEVP